MTPCVRFLQDPGFQRPVLLCTQKQLLAESMLRFPSCCSQLVYSTTELSGHCRLPPTYTTRGKQRELPTYRMKLIPELLLISSKCQILTQVKFCLQYGVKYILHSWPLDGGYLWDWRSFRARRHEPAPGSSECAPKQSHSRSHPALIVALLPLRERDRWEKKEKKITLTITVCYLCIFKHVYTSSQMLFHTWF